MAKSTNASFKWSDLFAVEVYFPDGIYMNWMGPLPILSNGFKIHVSVDFPHALTVARQLLPVLCARQLNHKIVKNRDDLARQEAGNQRGKFITLYTNDISNLWDAVSVADPLLCRLQREAGVRPGHWPTDRIQGNLRHEERIGQSGMLFWRWYEGEPSRPGYPREA